MNETSKNSQSPEAGNAAKVITMGCRLNAHESDRIKALTDSIGLKDTIIVNSCAVTNEAVRRTRQLIRKASRNEPGKKIVVTGCAAQIDPQKYSSMSEVDAVVGNEEKLKAEEWQRVSAAKDPIMRVNDIMSVRATAENLVDTFGERSRAFLQVQNGCDHRCTFCIIPFGRGNSRSTPIKIIVDEARRLVDQGFNELVLTGVDITSYGADLDTPTSLGALVQEILSAVPSLFRLRLSSIDSAEIDDLLRETIIHDARIAPYLHLSLQSGDNMILKRMKRRHTREQAIEFCNQLKMNRSDIAFGADLIVGFPTETQEMFENSLALIEEADLSFVHVFPFSARAGTPAARMPQISGDIIKKRAAIMRSKSQKALSNLIRSIDGYRQKAVLEAGNRVRLGNFLTANLALPADLVSPPEAGDVLTVDLFLSSSNVLSALLLRPNSSEGL